MGEYKATVEWDGRGAPFLDRKYSRAHERRFDGGLVVPASSSPHVVPVPYSDASAVDPEEAFVASISSCHMLWFLSIAAKRGHRVLRYVDRAVGVMKPGPNGKLVVASVELAPHAVFSADEPVTAEILAEMHHEAHAECFIANSVRTEISTSPTFELT